MYRFTINQMILKTTEGDKPIVPKGINIIVGPNNSGKSRLLKEIRDYLSGDHKDINMISTLNYPMAATFESLCSEYDIESKMVKDMYGNWLMKVYSNKPQQALDMTTTLDNYYTRNINTWSGEWRNHFKEVFGRNNSSEFLDLFGSLFFQYLGTEERLTICKTQRNHGMDGGSTNYLSSIQYQSELLNNLRLKTIELFGKDIYLDNKTLGDRLVFRVGDNFDYIRSKAVIDENDARKLFNEKKLDDQGDGLKSFVSTFLSLYLNKGDILLIDEPEAFLHPPLARQLGEMIGECHQEGQIVFISTHSVEILKGILSKNQNVNVIRITQPIPFSNSIKIVEKDLLDSILQNPLLRVSRVLEGLFCDKVVLTEAEADELIYQELIEKIHPASGLYFAHGQNKQTLATIAKLYKEIGIPYEIITDFDVLRQPNEFSSFLYLMDIPDKNRQKMIQYANQLREIVNNSVDVSGLSEKDADNAKKNKRDEVYHKKGISFFDESIQKHLIKVIEDLSILHLHILETGELETLLKDYDVPYQEKNKWIVAAINKIAEIQKEDIPSDSYLFKFLSAVKGNKS
jgi:predicted ATPase